VKAVELTAAAVDDLRRAGPVLAPRLLEGLRVLAADDDPGVALVAPDTGFRLLVSDGDARRVVYRALGERVSVWVIVVAGVRDDGAVYSETIERMQAADPPEVVATARLLDRLGRVTGTATLPAPRRREPVPDWLAERLVADAGRERIAVAAMDAATAFETWNRFLAAPAPDP
jgi:mRNA interferase RelE/StbE